MNIGKSIKVACAMSCNTQLWLASEMGVSEQTVTNWVKDRFSPNLKALEQMADLFNMELSEFIKLGE